MDLRWIHLWKYVKATHTQTHTHRYKYTHASESTHNSARVHVYTNLYHIDVSANSCRYPHLYAYPCIQFHMLPYTHRHILAHSLYV